MQEQRVEDVYYQREDLIFGVNHVNDMAEQTVAQLVFYHVYELFSSSKCLFRMRKHSLEYLQSNNLSFYKECIRLAARGIPNRQLHCWLEHEQRVRKR